MATATWAWAGHASAFLSSPSTEILEQLRDHYVQVSHEAPTPSHMTAWRESMRALESALRGLLTSKPASRDWYLVLEYELPREGGRRPDLVILADGSILVVEFKGFPTPTPAAVDQVADYARDLADYHEGSHNNPVGALLCLTSSTEQPTTIKDATVVSGKDLGDGILMALASLPPRHSSRPRRVARRGLCTATLLGDRCAHHLRT